MALLQLDLNAESLQRLTEIAVAERRPIVLQAEMLLLQALGRWPVCPADPRAGARDEPVASE